MNKQAIDPVKARSVELIRYALAHEAAWNTLHSEAVKITGEGPLTSGIGNAVNAPWHVKDALRNLDRLRNQCMGLSLAEWRDAGRHLHTWQRLRDEVISANKV